MSDLEISALDWNKMQGLLPAVIQNAENGKVLMLGYMNQEALIATITTGHLTLYSRSRQRLWRKGETSGNSMALQHISVDCDKDSLLLQVLPKGPACHLGDASCYQPTFSTTLGILDNIIEFINERMMNNEKNNFVSKLLGGGVKKCSKKLGEEAVTTIIAAASNSKEELIKESADLIFYLIILLTVCEVSFYEVLQCLDKRGHS